MRRIAAAYRAAFADIPRPVWILASAMLVNRSGTMVLPFMSLYLTLELGFAATTAGLILGLYGIGSVVGSLIGGWFSDRFGAIRIQELSLLATGAGFLVLGRLRGELTVAVAVLAVSIAAESFRPAMFAAVAASSPQERQPRSFALIRLAVNLGMAIGPAVGGILAARHYSWLFVADALTCWAALVVLRVTLHRPARLRVEARRAEPGPSPWKDLPFVAFLGLMTLMACAFFQVLSTYPLHLRTIYHLSEARIGALFSVNALSIVVFEMLLMKRVEHLEPLRLVSVGSALVCGGLALVALGQSLALALVSVLVWTAGEMLTMPLANAAAARRAGAGASGRAMGAYTLSFSIAFVVSPLVGTAVFSKLGPDALWGGIGILGLLLAAGFAALAPRFRTPRSASPGDEVV